jgi:tetratricopeptide (TPR) repeat protein
MKKIVGRAVVIVMLLSCCIPISAQDSLRTNMKEDARRYFTEKNYTKALPIYRELLNSFPKEPEYQFSVGVCLVNLNSDPEEAIRLLRPVQVTDYSPLAWLYLGRALHIYYSFEDAIKAYSKFMLIGKPADIKYYAVERLIEMARNGIEYTRTGHPVMAQSMKTIQLEQLPLATEINGSGKLLKKPIEFCSKTDIRNSYRPWMYLPSYTEINEYVYVSGYDQGKKGQKQLFRIRNINHEIWGIPELLNETINTKYDEEYPYFDVKTSTLYFSSKGHSSMGGYDIFKSVYNWNTKAWSDPENLGFPINSPGDDYIYITDELNHSASFVSNRNTPPNQATLYRIRLAQDTTGIRFFSVDEIRKASQLIIENRVAEFPVISAAENELKEPVAEEADTLFFTPVKSDYNKILAEALLLQIKADSSARVTRDLRILARETTDDASKKQMVTDILRNDKEAKTLQREADARFAEARKLKPDGDTTHIKDSILQVNKVVNGITVLQYKDDVALPVAEDKQTGLSQETVREIEKTVETKKSDNFSVFDKSPYNESNPIPQGIEVFPGLVYRIQLGVFSKPKPNDAFGGISPVSFEQVQGSAILKYYAGLFYSMNSVAKALETVRANGFPDAFIVAFLDGKLITTEKAREIEFAGFKL